MKNKKLFDELTNDIKAAYETSATIEEAEKLAAKFLYGQIQAGAELKEVDLDARMRKTGVKAIKAKVYLDEATKGDKKPSDVMLNALVDTSALVVSEQDALDTAETERDQIKNYLEIFHEAHVYFRGLSRGRYE